MEITGKVENRKYAQGSKSEREAVTIETEAGERFLLRRQGGNAFHDSTLNKLLGKTVSCQGRLYGSTFILEGEASVLNENESH